MEGAQDMIIIMEDIVDVVDINRVEEHITMIARR
jgi:hypothetical protein